MKCLSVFSIFIHICIVNSQDNADEVIHFIEDKTESISCTLKSTGGLGTCRKSFDCMDGLTKSSAPIEYCPSDIKTSHGAVLVCCPNKENITPTITLIKNEPIVEQRSDSISRQKCGNYTEQLNFIYNPKFYGAAGGVDALPAEFPHMAVLGWTQPTGEINWNCGGSLISDDFIVTAAHCASDGKRPPDTIRISEHNLKTTNETQVQQFEISEIFVHPNYRESSVYDDIALMKLNGSVYLRKESFPACLWQTPEINETQAVAIGWGRLGFLEESADVLQKVTLDVIDTDTCNKFLPSQDKFKDGVRPTQMCAGVLAGGIDTCQGDSGGPLQVRVEHENFIMYHIVGVTSFGTFCAAKNSPGVYTKISAYTDWIESIVW